MEGKNFDAVFEKIALTQKTRDVFSSAAVYSVKLYKKEKRMELAIGPKATVSAEYVDRLQSELSKALPGIKDVSVRVSYHAEGSAEDIVSRSWDNIVYEISKLSPVCRGIMHTAAWNIEDGRLYIRTKHNTAFYMAKKQSHSIAERMLKDEYGLDISVFFKDEALSEEERQKRIEQERHRERELIERCLKTMEESANKKEAAVIDAAAEGLKNGVIFGKEFTGEPVKILDSKLEGERLIIRGEIFNVDKREIKGDKYIVSFDITDRTDSTTVKFFVAKKLFDTTVSENIKNGAYLKIRGDVQFDKYSKEINVMARDIALAQRPQPRMDEWKGDKRVELHLHTSMSSMDGITNVKKYIERAAKWGHKAIAVTDHGVVQAFPDAMNAAKKAGIKVIYGVEGYLVDDLGSVVLCSRGQTLDDEFVVFDIETTGLSKERDKITEIGAVKIVNGKITDSYSTFVNPGVPLSAEIIKLTGITDAMLADAPAIKEVLPEFLKFCGQAVLVAHNAGFDTGFIRAAAAGLRMQPVDNTVLDTVELARALLPELKSHKLNIVAKEMGVELRGHHRAVNDAKATAEIFIKFMAMLADKDVLTLDDINIFSSRTINYKKLKAYHIIILAKNSTGLRNLYELVSLSHLEYFFKRPRIPKSELMKRREGLILSSACEAGELYRAMLDNKPQEYIDSIVQFYDYLEIQPLGNNRFMINSPRVDTVNSMEDIKALNKRIVELGSRHNKPVAASCDVHFIDPEDSAYRKIIMAAEGFADADNQAPLYLRTTGEMLDEFSYLGEETARRVVIDTPNMIADMVEDIKAVPDGKYPPVIEGSEEELRRITNEKAVSIYGDPLPDIVRERLDKELNSIISNGYSVLYIIAQKLVWKSMEDGYLVGSRGSVGSSFAATMAGITEVNPLPPHYVCPECKYSDFNSEVVKNAAMQEGSGCDMPDMDCPKCGAKLRKEGHDIPFETFLGFNGDKEPDIDLNFSGEYQQQAHAYTEELFGKGHVFKAGTIGTLADKTAYGFVKKYLDERQIVAHNAEINRLVGGCTGIRRTTGQHPGGLVVVPFNHDIHEFCPIQRPANDVNSNITTTHFDYHSINECLLKLDLLGHDDPTVIRMLYDITGFNPQNVSLDDKETMSLFESPKALGVTPEEIGCETGTLGIPEFGTKFVRQMLLDTKPKTFSDLLRISGLSHGTDVWINNAQELISSGTITLKETISTRDSIMIYLINKGMDKGKSFKIMESVRKGKGLTDENIADMKAAGVPDWYINSCLKIKYMFPKAHAAAYVMMAYRIAYFKINYPLAYYAAYFTVRACDDFDYADMCLGIDRAKQAIRDIAAKGPEATTKDKNKQTVLEICVEYYARGFSFHPINLYKSQADRFIIEDGGLIPPFNSVQGLGLTAAQSIVDARAEGGEFKTIEEFRNRTTVGKTLVELLKENGVLAGIPETNQLTLF